MTSPLCDHQVSLGISGNWWLLQCSCLPALSRRGQGDSALQDINKDKRGHGYQTKFSKALPWFPGLQGCEYRHTDPPMRELLLPSDYCHCNVYSAAPLSVPRGQGPCHGLLFMNSCLPASIHSPYKLLLSAAFAGSATMQRTQDISPPHPWQHDPASLSAVILPRQWIPTQDTGCSICSSQKVTRQQVVLYHLPSPPSFPPNFYMYTSFSFKH